MLLTVRTRKEDRKNGVICLVSILSTLVMVLKYQSLAIFFKFVRCFRQKLTSFGGISSNVSERSYNILSEKIGIGFRVISYHLGEIDSEVEVLVSELAFSESFRQKHL